MRLLVVVCLCGALIGTGCFDLRAGDAAPIAAAPTPVTQPPGRAAASTARPEAAAATAVPEAGPMATAAPSPRATPAPASTAPDLDGLLDGVIPDSGATYAAVIEDLASGARTQSNADQSLPSASLYKLGLAWAVLREVQAGNLSLDAPITIEDEDTIEPEPYGGFGSGDAPDLRDALTTMLSVSSNAAAYALMRTIGRDQFTREMDRIGLYQTRVPTDDVAVTTANDMARLVRLVATSSDLNDESRALLARGMANVVPPDALRDTLPDEVGIYDKTGNLDDASNVVALLKTQRGTAILVVIDTDSHPGDARAVIAHMAQVAYKALLQ